MAQKVASPQEFWGLARPSYRSLGLRLWAAVKADERGWREAHLKWPPLSSISFTRRGSPSAEGPPCTPALETSWPLSWDSLKCALRGNVALAGPRSGALRVRKWRTSVIVTSAWPLNQSGTQRSTIG